MMHGQKNIKLPCLCSSLSVTSTVSSIFTVGQATNTCFWYRSTALPAAGTFQETLLRPVLPSLQICSAHNTLDPTRRVSAIRSLLRHCKFARSSWPTLTDASQLHTPRHHIAQPWVSSSSEWNAAVVKRKVQAGGHWRCNALGGNDCSSAPSLSDDPCSRVFIEIYHQYYMTL